MLKTITHFFYGVVLFAVSSISVAQSYPDRPIHLIVPFTTGGVLDTLARTIGHELSVKYDQQVIVENRTGASGNIGTSLLARAKADGYTIGMGTIATHGINPALYKDQLPYDPINEFQPLALVAEQTNIVLVSNELNVNNIQELIDYAKKQGQIAYGSAGNGSSQHLSGQLFKLQTGIDLLHVPYRGSVPALTDLAANRVQLMFVDIPAALPFIQTDKVSPIAVTASERSDVFPDLPTVAEQGVDDFNVRAWFGVFAPAKTPDAIVKKLSDDIVEIMNKEDVLASLKKLGIDPKAEGPQVFQNYMEAELKKWKTIVDLANITM